MTEKRRVVIFCAGRFAEEHFAVVEKYFAIQAFCDNDANKHGLKFCDKYEIYPTVSAIEKFPHAEFLVAVKTRNLYEKIDTQLKNLGVPHRHVNDALLDVCEEIGESFFITEEGHAEVKRIEGSKERNIFVLTSPYDSNLGDQAQTMCTEKLLGRKYSGKLFIYNQAFVIKDYFEINVINLR